MSREIRKLLFVSDAPHFGGAERYVANMVSAAGRRGIGSAVCWLKPADCTADVFAEARQHGAELETQPAEQVCRLDTLVRSIRLRIRHHAADAVIVNACGRARFWSVPWAARFEQVPAVWVHHMVDQADYRRFTPSRLGGRVEGLNLWRWPQAIRHRLAAAASSAVIALNEQDRTHIARDTGVSLRHIHVVSNGIDTGQYRFDPQARAETRRSWMAGQGSMGQEPFIVGTAGRLVHGKGIEMLLQAAAQLRAGGLPVRVVVAGEGPDRAWLESICSRVGVGDIVLFLGAVADMTAFYSGLDAFALCSSTESFGLVLAEAMACERPVIATPTAGARSQIDAGLTGVLLKSYSADDLARSLVQLFEQPHLRDQLGANARRRVLRDFSVDACLDRTFALLSAKVTRIEAIRPAHTLGAMEEAA